MFNRFITWLFNLDKEVPVKEAVFVDVKTHPVITEEFAMSEFKDPTPEEVANEAVSQPNDGLDSSVKYWLEKDRLKEERKRKKAERLANQ